MKLVPWRNRSEESDAVTRLRDEVDRLFDEAFTMPFGMLEGRPQPAGLQRWRNGGWIPAMDVSETEQEITLRMEVPGLDADALDIAITGNTLTLTGEKKEETERKDENFYHRERRFGSFRRTVELPEGVDVDKITAEYDNGIAVIHVPRKAGVKPRHVQVKPTANKG